MQLSLHAIFCHMVSKRGIGFTIRNLRLMKKDKFIGVARQQRDALGDNIPKLFLVGIVKDGGKGTLES